MKISVQQAGIQTVEADAIIVNLFEDVSQPSGATGAVDQALDGAISELIAQGDLTGKLGQTVTLYPRQAIPAKRVIVVGLGSLVTFDLETVREVSAVAIKRAQTAGASTIATIIHGGGIGGLNIVDAAQAVVEGSLLALYQYSEHQADDKVQPQQLSLVEFDDAKIDPIKRGANVGQIIAESVCLARDWVNQPSNRLTPTTFALESRTMSSEVGLICRILEEAEMSAHGMGAMLAVTKGSAEPAKFVTLEHRPVGEAKNGLGPIVLVGKGITFDTGGYTLKTRQGLIPMKKDMAGAGAVIGAMRAIALLNLPLHVFGLIPAAENVISGTAFKPGEVFTAKNGVSIEIISTDSEGRMVLADALCYADTLNPSLVIDVATLTGGKVMALGHRFNALFCENGPLSQALLKAGQKTGEPLWPMPLDPAFDRQLQSQVADLKNNGGTAASSVTAARFLAHFVGQWPWAHIDMVGNATYSNTPEYTPRSYLTQGATGSPLRSLVEFLRQQSR